MASRPHLPRHLPRHLPQIIGSGRARSGVRRFLLGSILAGAVSLGWANVTPALAQPLGAAAGASNGAHSESLVAERQRLRGELERVQAEIDQLKKADRGLRADYRLRARMADAEALARRLTELDTAARSRPGSAATGAAAAGPSWLGQEPAAVATDGPAELEAKADILADQSRRVKLQVGVLKARIDQLRGRQELRRRAHQLDNDPFAPLEGSKRRVVTVVPGAPASQLTGGSTTATTDQAGRGPATPTFGVPTSAPGGASAPAVTTPPPTTSTPIGTAPPPTTPPTTPTAASVQLRDVLDPATLAQMRKLEQEGSPAASLESMQKAMAALAAKAQHLHAQSELLRARARAR